MMWWSVGACVLLIQFISASEIGEQCINKEAPNGICSLITDCEVALRIIEEQGYHKFNRCGFTSSTEVVCCPKDPYKTPTTDLRNSVSNSVTTTTRKLRVADRECQKIINTSVPPFDTHIIGGINASLGEFPHQVALGYTRSDGYEFLCGASLLSDKYLITAAHCVTEIPRLNRTKPTIVRMGVVDIGGKEFNPTTDIEIAEIKPYPSYTRKTQYNDLAIIRLETPAKLSINLNPICLYTLDTDPQATLTVTGWGKINSRNDLKSDTLLKANVTMVARTECTESYQWHKLPDGITESQLCAGDPLGRFDACQGDSGGPLQAFTESDGYYRLIGVTSFGRGCGSSVPGVYVRISRYLDWIESVVWPNELPEAK